VLVRHGSGPPGGAVKRTLAFPTANRFCMARLYGRAGRLTVQNDGFWPWQGPKAESPGRELAAFYTGLGAASRGP
jgi:hypothetical protein